MADMRVLRSSAFAEMGSPPVTVVFRDEDVVDTLESIIAGDLDKFREAFVIHEVFTMKRSNIVHATLEAERRRDRDREDNMAILFHWTILALRSCVEGGVVFSDRNAPLSADEITVVYEQVAMHPEYANQRVVTHDERGKRISLEGGEVKV